ncbi:hypothetical protein BRO54_3653 [Geobacillus proteiniphilus]|uniref:Flavinylation-associated cytochrome domain-containing protein n=1 Tax=Geobacillus proteiniphilus TaxID=860353 RepID=A0A1Q5SKB9_9BACL|nr:MULTISPECIES: DUF4405 domain-containing protein [Geobacillus]OKO88451.1 hypothetical protein BRO54_3653 [Geobacillus proteiniphilus]WJQ07970.1 DUF4405 domain-containing protein [Geobacillus stearothermophilus]
MRKNYVKMVLDLSMAITFVLLMNPKVFNGLPFHEMAGLVIAVAILIHIGLNYRWVINTTKKIFALELPRKTRFSFLLNILLLISMTTVIVSGILISRVVFPNLAIEGNHFVRGIHDLSANMTLALVGLHIGVHWQWIMSTCKKAFKSKEGKWRKGVIASAVLSLAVLAGGMYWISLNVKPSEGDFKPKFAEQNAPSFDEKTAGTMPTPPDGEIRDGKFRKERGSNNPLLALLTYFVIWAAIIIPTYYFEKRMLKNKRAKEASV